MLRHHGRDCLDDSKHVTAQLQTLAATVQTHITKHLLMRAY